MYCSPPDNINGGPVCLGVERLCKLVAAVIMKICGVDVEDQLAVMDGVLLETAGGNGAILLHLPEHLLIAAGWSLKVDVQMTAFGDDILVPVAGFLSLVVSFGVCNVALRSGLVAHSGAIHAIVSCHGIASFLGWVL